MKVYLAGPIFGCSDEEAYGWRKTAERKIAEKHLQCITPRDYRGLEDEYSSAIVESDKADIQSCDVVLAFAMKPTWGTAMEIHLAHSLGKRVVAVVDGPVSPWLRYHAEIVPSLKDAIEVLSRNPSPELA
jgi:nucleoside 2-deoxyribosyltransferase